MAKIYVHTPFELQHGQEKLVFGVGPHDVHPEVADHWYAQHFIGEDPGAGKSEDSQAADALLVELDGREQDLRKQLELLEAEKAALVEREKAVAEAEEAAKAKAADLEKRDRALADAESAVQAKVSAVDAREVAVAEREKAAEPKADSTKNSKK
ncbi:MAG: hypothetical protein J0I15_25525 [Herbaspirillum huttiense]|uniref:STY1053 family phage-associated protein n=1 Tax=Herbaspirillum huttiense TaxID=863372 RepID=UPI001AC5E477|nr:hypothetical protein [Herbaspirillum huttiense]MBN9359823.1 hypothetical protein [Herbaspirillum huttiense]